MDAAVLVLNADLGPLHRVSFRHAIRMLVRQVAVVHEAEPGRIVGPWPAPKVLRLVPVRRHAVAVHRRAGLVRPGVVARDRGRCGYCDGRATTVDHITPRCRGGRNTWKNTVAACGPCNQRKGDRTPAEAGMVLRIKPTAPSWASLARR